MRFSQLQHGQRITFLYTGGEILKRTYKREGYWIINKPSLLTVRHLLSNGQYLTMRFRRRRVGGKGWLRVCYVWNVAVYIGDLKAAKIWDHKKQATKQTGECGLEGLRVALGYLNSFAYDYCGWRDQLEIGWEDEKRRRAYRWLLKYPGFALSDDGTSIVFRHPDLYEFIGE